MKKIVFILLVVVNVGLINGQCTCCGSSSSISGGELTPVNYSLGRKQLLIELSSDFRLFNPVKSINSPDPHVQTNSAISINNMVITSIGLRYGVSSKLNVSVQQPYMLITGPTISSKTFGDLLTLANLSVLKTNKLAVNCQGGMEWPTGENLKEENGNSIAGGSGSFDPVLGLGFSGTFKKSVIRASVFYKHTTDGFNKINYGKFCTQQVGYNYIVMNRQEVCTPDSTSKSSTNKSSLAISALLSGEWLQMQTKNYAIIENTGGYTVVLGLGATLSVRGFSIPVMVTVPLCQYMHGQQNQNLCRIRLGLSKTFN